MASRQAAVLARRGASLIASASSSSSAVRTGCVSFVARSFSEAALPGAERGCATAAFVRRSACLTDPSMRSGILLYRSSLQCPTTISNKCPGVRISSFHSTSTVNAVQEIGMPSLSPTMTQGNIAKWLKKEGDKVSAGDILCEIETDKATLEMESMEDGYLGKILVPNGAKDIPCGQAICLMVETEDELKNVGSHKPAGGGSSPPPKASAPPLPKASAPPPPKEPAPPAAAVGAPPRSAQKPSSSAAPPPPGVMAIGMPSLSPTMTQGNIAKWRKNEGDKVSAGDILCDIETVHDLFPDRLEGLGWGIKSSDKATLEMESMEDGYLGKILVGDGSKDIPCGQAICLMVEAEDQLKTIGDFKPIGGETPSSPPAAAAAPSPPPTKAASPAASKPSAAPPPRPTGSRVFASPAARKLAEDKNVSLSSIKGTGPQGSVLKADVQEYLATGASPSQRPTKGVPAGGAVIGDVNYRDVPNTQIRKITAKRLLASKQTIPHYYLSLDTRVDKILRLREELNRKLEASKKKDGPVKKVSLNDFVIKAAALALKKVPEVNASWNEEFIREYHNVNISIAVQTEHGLMVPVVKDADKKGLETISDDIKALAGKARSNTLKPNDYEGGTFTVSNLGSFGIKQFCAIVNPPQACILAVGFTEKRVCPGADPDTYEPGTFMTVTLSCDHRVIDGAVGAQWLRAFKGYIEDPITLML